ncbi:MAG: sterol desaturase [Thalassobius sp.]|nr:sterol desaturase [Thalassovita sp.]
MDLSPVVLSIPIYFLLIGLELIYTLVKRPDYYRMSDSVTNISCGIGDQIIGIFAKVITLGFYQYLYEYHAFLRFESSLLSFIILFIAVDFIYYWVHRWSHEVNFLWAGHVVHHQSEEYNLSVALRQSWFHKFFTFIFYLPLALFGFDTLSFVWANGLNLLYQFWIHTEVIKKLGPLEYILNTPSHHRVHHGRNPEYIDKNHGGVFIIWDRLFGTFEEEKEKPVYGITTPLTSWNPVWANVSHWYFMYKESKLFSTWQDKFRIFIKPPGWRPAYAGGQLKIPLVRRDNYRKFRTVAPKSLNFYIFFQYAITVAGTAFFLFNEALFSLEYKIAGALLIILAVMNFGFLFERKKRGLFLESIRLVLSCLFITYTVHQQPNFEQVLFISSITALFSLSWLMTQTRYFKQ